MINHIYHLYNYIANVKMKHTTLKLLNYLFLLNNMNL